MRFLRNRWFWLVVLGLGGVALVWSLHARFPDALSSRGDQIGLVHALLILGFVGSSLVLHRQFNTNKVVRYGLLWLAVGGVVFIGVSFRNDMQRFGNRLLGELIPSAGQQHGEAMQFQASADGHFVIEAAIETDASEAQVRMLVDTGATDVVLSPGDAQRLGFDLGALSFTKIYQTANGQIRGAPVTLREIRIGSIRIENVRASVNGADIGRSLLGMNFLNRLSGYEVTDGSLILYP